MRTVYMLDFGLARLYLNARGDIRSPRLVSVLLSRYRFRVSDRIHRGGI